MTGAVFRNQGGVDIEAQSRVPRKAGTSLPNLLAAAGPARGVSGKEVWGTLTGSTHSRPACPSKRYSGWTLATWITPSRPKSATVSSTTPRKSLKPSKSVNTDDDHRRLTHATALPCSGDEQWKRE